MNHDELVANAREIFEGGEPGEAYTLKEYQQELYEGTDGEEIATQEDIRAACEELVAEGVLEPAGKDAYALTYKRAVELQREDEERMLEIYKEYFSQQKGKK